MQIAFICTANVCRSVMAHAILERIVRTRNLDIEVTSAGIYDFNGTPPADNAWITCLQNDSPISKMESSFIGNIELEKIDHFLAMEKEHQKFLISNFEIQENQVRLLGSFDNLIDELEIADPINKPKKAFQDCFNRIERCIEIFLTEIAESNKSQNPYDEKKG